MQRLGVCGKYKCESIVLLSGKDAERANKKESWCVMLCLGVLGKIKAAGLFFTFLVRKRGVGLSLRFLFRKFPGITIKDRASVIKKLWM